MNISPIDPKLNLLALPNCEHLQWCLVFEGLPPCFSHFVRVIEGYQRNEMENDPTNSVGMVFLVSVYASH